MFDFVKKAGEARPIIVKCVGGAIQGYAFGCVVGLFTDKKKPNMSTIALDAHNVGRKFAMVGMIYSATEIVLEKYQGRRPINGVISSTISGVISQRKSGIKSMVTTAAAFTLYNSAYQAYDLK